MSTFFSTILDSVRAWLGLDHDRLHAPHGWLLREPALVRAQAVVPARMRGTRR